MNLPCFYSNIDSGLLKIINAICIASIEIENCIRYSSLKGLHGEHGEQNSSGDLQKKLDVVSNDIMIHYLTQTNCCNILLSEENDKPIILPKKTSGQIYLVAFDPLDGSSNIDCNAPIGTIFSICENKTEKIFLPGSQITIAGYVLYGPSTELVVSVNNTVDRFVLSPKKEYIHLGKVHLNGKNKKIYSINEANSNIWNNDIKTYINGYKVDGTKYTARYIGSMVGDVHRTLLYGGMFCYPADNKNRNGKLRLLYEAYPMAKLIETAGGTAIVGDMSMQRILDVEPKEIHQKTPILLGTSEEIDKYKKVLNKKTSKL